MAFKAKIKGPDGRCCCAGGFAIIFCSTRGGIATLKGESEFSDPANGINVSIPPKKYRALALSGQTYMYESGTGACPIPTDDGTGQQTQTYSGGKTYSLTTGNLVTNNGDVHEITTGCYTTSDTHNSVSGILTSPRIPNHVTSTTQTQAKGIGCGGSICASGTILNYADPAQIATAQLSNEDSEFDAISRIPGINVWSGYTSCGSDPICCRTAYQLRGAGDFDLEYIEARIRTIGSGYPPSTALTMKVDLLRKPYGTGSYSLYATLEHDFTSTSLGLADVDFGVLPNDVGWETVASNARATVI